MKTILLAEHDTFLINVYASQFRKLGYSTTIASDGHVALLRIKNINPDLIILDVGLPNLEILKDEIELNKVKIIMLADFYQPGQNNNNAELGALKYFSKTENTAEEIAQGIKAILS